VKLIFDCNASNKFESKLPCEAEPDRTKLIGTADADWGYGGCKGKLNLKTYFSSAIRS
jgi:hypothetical protein